MLEIIARVLAVTTLIASAASCSEEDPNPAPNPRAQRCEQLAAAACAVFVRCRAMTATTGRVFDDELCAQTVPTVTSNCVTRPENDGVSTASDAEITACVSAYERFPCSDLCGQIAEDPPECQALDAQPSQNVVECAP